MRPIAIALLGLVLNSAVVVPRADELSSGTTATIESKSSTGESAYLRPTSASTRINGWGCTFCYMDAVQHGNLWYATLDVDGDCEEDMGSFEWCALCNELPSAPPGSGYDCPEDAAQWENDVGYSTANEAIGSMSGDDCYAMRCQLSEPAPSAVELLALIEAREYRGIAALISASPLLVSYNDERIALQAFGCSQAVETHIPLTMEVGKAIAQALQIENGRTRAFEKD